MFKWPEPPSPRAPKHELADFAELICWRDESTSATDLSRLLGRLVDNDYAGGVGEEDEAEQDIEEAYTEIERRQEVCGRGYPFTIGCRGQTLRSSPDSDDPGQVIYRYLLLATRLDMSADRVHADIDGTKLFERLAAEVARVYFGTRAESLVFGTGASAPSFQEKVNDLCRRLKEGGGFVERGPTRMNPRDGKLDVVVWKPFCDGLPGKLIGFGQCKTGTHYRDSLTQLQPDAFCQKWLQSSIVVLPVRMFFISESLILSADERHNLSIDAGLTFDRCRIIDFCGGISDDVMACVREWTAAAAKAAKLPSM